MKDGRTHLAHKAEHAIDFETGAMLAVTLQPANRGDTSTVIETMNAVESNLASVMQDENAARKMHRSPVTELVADKGYHSNAVLTTAQSWNMRTYVSEPDRGRRQWKDQPEAQAAVYANRRRVKGDRGKALLRKRGELLERSFAHCYDTGGMRRTHLRRHDNILKRILIHTAGFNLGLLLRKKIGFGTPRGLQGRLAGRFGRFVDAVMRFLDDMVALRALCAKNTSPTASLTCTRVRLRAG